jgi:hypothetical protein
LFGSDCVLENPHVVAGGAHAKAKARLAVLEKDRFAFAGRQGEFGLVYF